mmetsp:Transcript_9430/g.28338  ORF Transcript_9430/g.28338 Transcript_9430/m.28338 type:complete len:142 (-) Transcript_9430:29-454(-)
MIAASVAAFALLVRKDESPLVATRGGHAPALRSRQPPLHHPYASGPSAPPSVAHSAIPRMSVSPPSASAAPIPDGNRNRGEGDGDGDGEVDGEVEIVRFDSPFLPRKLPAAASAAGDDDDHDDDYDSSPLPPPPGGAAHPA